MSAVFRLTWTSEASRHPAPIAPVFHYLGLSRELQHHETLDDGDGLHRFLELGRHCRRRPATEIACFLCSLRGQGERSSLLAELLQDTLIEPRGGQQLGMRLEHVGQAESC